MTRHKIPSPRYEVCQTYEEALAFVERAPFGLPFVIKADGLASGKGSVIVKDAAEARTVVGDMMSDKKFGSAGAKTVMEEFLAGEEVSFLVFSDGARVVPMVSVQDHKRALDGDDGARTRAAWARSPRPRTSPSTCTSRSCRRSCCPRSRDWPPRDAAIRACSTPAS